jgi:hypothetical protein
VRRKNWLRISSMISCPEILRAGGPDAGTAPRRNAAVVVYALTIRKGLWLDALVRRGARAASHARGHGRDARHRRGTDQADPTGCTRAREGHASNLAGDRPQFPQALDGIRSGRWPQNEGTFRAHQLPLSISAHSPQHLPLLESWLQSYRPAELFESQGRLKPELAELAPTGERRMSANPHANGGMLLRDLRIPDFRDYAISIPSPRGWRPGRYPCTRSVSARRGEAECAAAPFSHLWPG